MASSRQAPERPLESPALGSSLSSLIAPCNDSLRPASPPPATRTPIGATFSGGGFRATFAALGVVRYLADAGVLGDLRYSSSVSGGSVANGLLATTMAGTPGAAVLRRRRRRARDRTARGARGRVLAQDEADPQRVARRPPQEPDRRTGVGVRRLAVRQGGTRVARRRVSLDLQRVEPRHRDAVRVRTRCRRRLRRRPRPDGRIGPPRRPGGRGIGRRPGRIRGR